MFRLSDHPENLAQDYVDEYGEGRGRNELKDLIKATEQNPLKYFVPNLVQERMIKKTANAMEESPIATVLMTSGNGVGKTLV